VFHAPAAAVTSSATALPERYRCLVWVSCQPAVAGTAELHCRPFFDTEREDWTIRGRPCLKHNPLRMFLPGCCQNEFMLPMPATKLDSSLLASVQYDPRRRHLDVEFRSGLFYRYFNVPALCYRELLAANSKGQYFNRTIRNCFPYQNLSRPSTPLVLAAEKTK
jgi:hypothetical protein